jgi:hypothetical protein
MFNQLRNWLHSKRWYVRMRSIQRIGIMRWLRWQILERKILQTAPVRTRPIGDSGASCEFRVLTWKGDWRLGLWAAKSFYHFSGVDWPISFHDGGELNDSIRSALQYHFPQARIVGWDEATAMVESRLYAAGHSNLVDARRRNVMLRKLVDFAAYSTAPNMACVDSDVLFVGPPTELVRLGESTLQRPTFNRDSHSLYSISDEEAQSWFGLSLPQQLNAGLSVVPVQSVDFGFLNKVFAPGRVPADKDIFPEQTACALLAARLGPSYLPPEYTVATGTPPLDIRGLGLVSRHYVGPVRHLLYEEGLPYLLHEMNLVVG